MGDQATLDGAALTEQLTSTILKVKLTPPASPAETASLGLLVLKRHDPLPHRFPYPLSQTCLDLVLVQVVQQLLTPVKTGTFASLETQLVKLQSIIRRNRTSPPLASHLITRLVRRFICLTGRDGSNYGPEDLPWLFYLAILSIYEHTTVFGFCSNASAHLSRHHSYRQIVLGDRLELKLIHSHLGPSCLTLLDLAGHSKLTDSDLVYIHTTIGQSVRLIRIDFTSITDIGISHLTRVLSISNGQSISAADRASNKAFANLQMMSLKGLKAVTDRSASKLSRLPSLVAIDFSQTSCTSATKLIINRSQLQRGFEYARSQSDLELFSDALTPSEKLCRLCLTDQLPLFEINRLTRSHPSRKPSSIIGHRLQDSHPSSICLIRACLPYPPRSSPASMTKKTTATPEATTKNRNPRRKMLDLSVDEDLREFDAPGNKRLHSN